MKCCSKRISTIKVNIIIPLTEILKLFKQTYMQRNLNRHSLTWLKFRLIVQQTTEYLRIEILLPLDSTQRQWFLEYFAPEYAKGLIFVQTITRQIWQGQTGSKVWFLREQLESANEDKRGQADIHSLLTFEVTGQTREIACNKCLYSSQEVNGDKNSQHRGLRIVLHSNLKGISVSKVSVSWALY